jgi:hypothetical protein
MGYYAESISDGEEKDGPVIRELAVEQGISRGTPGVLMTYVAMGHLLHIAR